MSGTRRRLVEWEAQPNGCWITTSHSLSAEGHPKVFRDGKRTSVSRFIYEVLFGFLPKGIVVRHTCDNPRCINPEHLTPGTQAQNIQDSIDRGRHNRRRGEKQNFAALKESDIPAIRADKRFGYIVAKDYNVSASTINKVRRGETWGWCKSND